MGLKISFPVFFLFFLAVNSLNAAPTLRLSSATVGPVSIVTGTNGPAQTVQATNIGDGTLALGVSASVSWLAPTVGSGGTVQIGLQTAALAKGIYTGIVTVNDPNAVDAPQDITVTVQIGGAAPDQVDLYVAPNGSTAETFFSTNSMLSGSVETANNLGWLSFSLSGTASFRFSFPYRIAVTHLAEMAEGAYNGTVTTSGAGFAADNKMIAVTMHVTAQPIAQVAPASLMIRMAQGAPKQVYNLVFSNSGLGTLAINGIFTNTGSGGTAWLSALNTGLVVAATIDPSGLAPGAYQGTLTVNSNAANGQVAIPVSLQIVPQSAPVTMFQGVQDNVLFATVPLAPGETAVVVGEQFTFGDLANGPSPPLAMQVGGAQVLVNDQPAPIYYTSYGRIGFQVPYETPQGTATLRVVRDGQRGNAVAFTVVERAPRLMRLGVADYGYIVNQDGSNPIPTTPGGTGHPAHPGDTLMIFGIGFGQTDPPAASGAPAPGDEPLARLNPLPNVTFGGGFTGNAVSVQPLFAGLTPGFAGLYRIDVVVPDEAPTSPAVALTVDMAGSTSNTVQIAIDPLPTAVDETTHHRPAAAAKQ